MEITKQVNDITGALVDAAMPIECIGTAEEHVLQKLQLAIGMLDRLYIRVLSEVEADRGHRESKSWLGTSPAP